MDSWNSMYLWYGRVGEEAWIPCYPVFDFVATSCMLLCCYNSASSTNWYFKQLAAAKGCCLNICLLLFYCSMDLGSWFPSLEAYHPHQMFHITQCEKPPILSDFLQVHTSTETWYFIFHSALWMSLWGMPVHMQQALPVFDQLDRS